MPRPALRTRSRKRKIRSLPGGQRKVLYFKEKVSGLKCAICKCNINFLPHSTLEIRKLAKTQRKISRIYGGQFCHNCLRNMLKQATRML